jgi:hypothetical protein
LVEPAVRLTLRMLVCPFGPVVVDWTLPPPRIVERVAVLPFGPVTVEVLLTWAVAAKVQRAKNDTVTVRERKLIFSSWFAAISAPVALLRTRS